MSNPLDSTPTPRLNELITAVGRATPASFDDADELAEVEVGLKAIREERLAGVRRSIRNYVYAALRRAAVENPGVAIEDVTSVAVEECSTLIAPATMQGVLDGSISAE